MTTTATSEPFLFSPGATAPSTGPTGSAGADSLVNETRREIAEIVREVAVAVRSDRSADQFFGLLVDRIQRAMAAEGVIVWQVAQANPKTDSHAPRGNVDPAAPRPSDNGTAERSTVRAHAERGHEGAERGHEAEANIYPVRRLGRITDQSIPTESHQTHQRLLSEVSSEGQPVVVPATPGATDPQVPANPMDVSVALVPIELEPSTDGPAYLLEVFLESDCGIATQRGYLRFVAQMADLAGEFLRSDQLRRLRRRHHLAGIVDDAVMALHRIDDPKMLQATIVDRAAEIFEFDRVGLCIGQPAKLIAVSHVETIDDRSDAAKQLCRAATTPLDDDGCSWFDKADSPDSDLVVRAVVTDLLESTRQLVCMQATDVEPIADECRGELIRYMQHANMALENKFKLHAIPGGRLLASLAPRTPSLHGRRWRRFAVPALFGIIAMIVAIVPIPLVVTSTAIIRPEQVQVITALRDAVVDQIYVRHGQTVATGDLLMTLVDPDLEEQMTALIGRRAVLIQQQSHWTEALVDTASLELDRLEQVQGEARLVTEEIQSIDDQLAVLRRVEEALQIRATRDGVVDAWQIEQRLQSRPLKRGDWLLQVIAVDSSWSVEANVSQSRVAHLRNASEDESLYVNVSLDSEPTQTFSATLERIGPAIEGDTATPVSTAVLLTLDDEAARTLTEQQGTGHQSGAPASVMFHCGTAPAAYLLFQDLIRSVRGTLALYRGGDKRNEI